MTGSNLSVRLEAARTLDRAAEKLHSEQHSRIAALESMEQSLRLKRQA